MVFGASSNRGRIEIGALNKYGSCCLCNAAACSAEYPGNTHGILFVADHEICHQQLSLNAVERNERFVFLRPAHRDLSTFYLVVIKSMQWLPELMQNKIGGVNYVV